MRVAPECLNAEQLAGAIALAEAADWERERYRAHLARCARCLDQLGGEREIERVMTTVAQARDDERWEPRLAGARAPRRGLRAAGVAAAVAAALVVIVAFSWEQRSKAPTHARSAISAAESRALAALDTQTFAAPAGRAESLTVGTSTISASLRVTVDRRGLPLRCTIAKSSGDRALDAAICRAALQARVPAAASGR